MESGLSNKQGGTQKKQTSYPRVKAEVSDVEKAGEAGGEDVAADSGDGERSERLRLINILLSESERTLNRSRAAWRLTENPNDEVMIYLKSVLESERSPARLRATIVEGLSRSGHPEARGLVLSALGDDEEIVVRGAIRGLSRIGDQQSVEILTAIMLSKDSAVIVEEAAEGLGRIERPSAFESLKAAYGDKSGKRGGEFRQMVIGALGKRRISETGDLFGKVLSEGSAESRLGAIEALEDCRGDATELLRRGLADKRAEVRAAAAWTLATRGDRDDMAVELTEALIAEQNTEVRMRLYQALEGQKKPDMSAIAPIVSAEVDTEARLAGYDLMATVAKNSESAKDRRFFDRVVVEELAAVALGDKPIGQRFAAVNALQKANTAASNRALETIFVNTADARVARATGFSKAVLAEKGGTEK